MAGSILVLVLALIVVLGVSALAGEDEPASRPNVVVVMTDDQDAASVRVMTEVERLLAGEGTTFENSYATTPLCCPSRASYFTGQYAHNHQVLTNGGPRGGYYELDGSETLPVWLQRAGYRTAHVGKYLNSYGKRDPREVPPGWDEWYTQTGASQNSLYDYTQNENGELVEYGEAPGDYKTDVFADQAVRFIERSAPSSRPFFLTVSTLVPHRESGAGAPEHPDPRPAPRHEGDFRDEPLPTPPSFNEEDVSDKPQAIGEFPPLDPLAVDFVTQRYRARLASLLAVDDLVERVVSALEEAGELDDTLIAFTSDNGYLHGEHRIPIDKRYVYEESVRVPLILRGPGVPAGETRSQPVANIDLAPTILEAAGARAGLTLDGQSLTPLIEDPDFGGGRALLIEYFGNPTGVEYPGRPDYDSPPYSAVHTNRYVYVRHSSGEEELYDLEVDPFQLESRHADPGYAQVRERLGGRLDELEGCAGEDCL